MLFPEGMARYLRVGGSTGLDLVVALQGVYLASIFTVIMLTMYTRRLTLPPRTFLLLGPRGTGKTTWLRRQLPQAQWYNLLLDRELLRLMREPGAFRREIEALPMGA